MLVLAHAGRQSVDLLHHATGVRLEKLPGSGLIHIFGDV